jgi:hypothetical protein
MAAKAGDRIIVDSGEGRKAAPGTADPGGDRVAARRSLQRALGGRARDHVSPERGQRAHRVSAKKKAGWASEYLCLRAARE